MSNISQTKLRSHILPLVMISLGMLFIVYNYFVQVAPSVMTQQLMQTYGIDAKGLGLLGSLFLFSYALMQIPAGLLLDRFGARRMLTLAIFISGIGVCLFGLSHAFALAGFSRVLAGGGAAFSFLGGLYIAARWFEHKRFALIAGILQLGSGIGSIIGEVPLSSLVNHYGWRGATLFVGAPLFISFALFKSTQGIFDRWLGKIVGYALLIFFISIVLGFVLSIANWAVSGIDQRHLLDLRTVSFIPIAIVVCIGIGLLKHVVTLSHDIGNAISTASSSSKFGNHIGARVLAMGSIPKLALKQGVLS